MFRHDISRYISPLPVDGGLMTFFAQLMLVGFDRTNNPFVSPLG